MFYQHTGENWGRYETPEKQRRAQKVLSLLVRSRNWLVWSADVHKPTDTYPYWEWIFHDDFAQALPGWFDIDRRDDENLAFSLSRVRLPEDDARCNSTSTDALTSGATGYNQMFRVRLRDGRLSWVEENVTIEPLSDSHWHVVGICIDATDRKQAEERLQLLNEELQAIQSELETHNEELLALRESLQSDKEALAEANERLSSLAITDGLTGVLNHRAFQEQLEKDWNGAARYNKPVSLIMLDIDRFKQFNDTYGHPAGDIVLKRVGEILTENARQCDCIARYGGEEFVIILPETDSTGAFALAERFRTAIEVAVWPSRSITASFGVATSGPSVFTPQDLISEADRALYDAKRGGRNCVRHAMHLRLVHCLRE
ncbi:MAG: diguanylate cyclase [Capsulimonadaceae bacterium]